MANAFFDQCKESLWKGDIDLDIDTIKCHLYDTNDGAVSTTTDDFEDDIAAAGEVATATLATITVSAAGVFDAGDTTFVTVSGDESEALIIWKDTGTPATSPLMIYIDTATGLPVTPNGFNIIAQWNASGIANW